MISHYWTEANYDDLSWHDNHVAWIGDPRG